MGGADVFAAGSFFGTFHLFDGGFIDKDKGLAEDVIANGGGDRFEGAGDMTYAFSQIIVRQIDAEPTQRLQLTIERQAEPIFFERNVQHKGVGDFGAFYQAGQMLSGALIFTRIRRAIFCTARY